MNVRVCGPNLNDQSRGTFHVHADGCRDLGNYGPGGKQGGELDGHNEMLVKDASVLSVVRETYGDQIAEQPEAEREEYVKDLVSDFWFAPCCKGLPREPEQRDIVLELLAADNVYDYVRQLATEGIIDMKQDKYLYGAMLDVRTTADNLKKLGEQIKRDVDAVTRYVSGEAAPFNSLGVLQSDGPRHDALCMLFYHQVGWLQKELTRAGL